MYFNNGHKNMPIWRCFSIVGPCHSPIKQWRESIFSLKTEMTLWHSCSKWSQWNWCCLTRPGRKHHAASTWLSGNALSWNSSSLWHMWRSYVDILVDDLRGAQLSKHSSHGATYEDEITRWFSPLGLFVIPSIQVFPAEPPDITE